MLVIISLPVNIIMMITLNVYLQVKNRSSPVKNNDKFNPFLHVRAQPFPSL